MDNDFLFLARIILITRSSEVHQCPPGNTEENIRQMNDNLFEAFSQ